VFHSDSCDKHVFDSYINWATKESLLTLADQPFLGDVTYFLLVEKYLKFPTGTKRGSTKV
jgi:hypothetical protein